MRRNEWALWLACMVAAAGAAEACMLGTPWELFQNRKTALQTLPTNSFAWEAAHLVPPGPVHGPHPAPAYGADSPGPDAADHLPQSQTILVAAMRAAPDGATALTRAGDLPDAVRLYTAGAVDFMHGDLAAADGFFSEELALPPPQSAPRAVWSQYMLGRIAAQRQDGPRAAAAFAASRVAALAGAPDPLGLAVASYGDEARLHLDRGDMAGAVALYAAQAAAGSDEAVQSLRIVAERIMAHPNTIPAADLLTQRLLVVYALARSGDYLNALHAGGTEFEMPFTGFPPPDDVDMAPLRHLAAVLAAAPAPATGTDRLAALLYAVGDYANAERLARAASGPMAVWVRAKIAVQRGDMYAAAALYAQALRDSQAPGSDTILSDPSHTLLRGEDATIVLARGDFQLAFATLWPLASTYWGDVAYLAERVSTVDALQAFVDAQVPAAAVPAASSDPWNHPDAAPDLRALLARRLMRLGRYDDAIRYFDAPPKGADDIRPAVRAFIAATRDAQTSFWARDRAEAGWRAATLLRTQGMAMLGTELNPDQAAFGGEYAYGFGPDEKGPVWQAGTFTKAEQARFAASAPSPDLRFHYRYLAVDAALQAATDVPRRSQAYAAMLCGAAGWMFDTHDPARMHDIYRTYVQNGAIVPFARHFGHRCPPPDFGSLAATRRHVAVVWLRDGVHRWKWPGGAAFLCLAAGGTLLVRQRRRRSVQL